jgi:type I restriction enzyme, R subunit
MPPLSVSTANDGALMLDEGLTSAEASALLKPARHIDWTVKESVRAKLHVIVKRILRKYGYPPDKQEAATNTVLQQAELLSDFWTVHRGAST